MTEQELQELNKKLAEWAGLILAKEPDYTGFYLFADAGGVCCTANFTHSLDASFEWLVPKALKLGYTVTVYASPHIVRSGERGTVRADVNGDYTQLKGNNYNATANTGREALALCLAIEKLINEEKDDNSIRRSS